MGELCNGNCGKKTGFLHGKKLIDGKPYCDECYYERLGKVIEEHPIGLPVIKSPKHPYPRASTFRLVSNTEWERYKKIIDQSKK